MGIKGLLQMLRPIETNIHISQYKNKTIAVDGHCILHRGCFGAASKLALGVPTESYIDHFMHYIGLFEYYDITPVVVFDGLQLPLKKTTNDERRKNRKFAMEQGLALHEAGRSNTAEKLFQQAVVITDDMIKTIARKLIEKKVECIVAPAEADAQLTHLIKTGRAEAVVTEDSDLIAFGCSKMIYKMDRFGNGKEISIKEILSHPQSPFCDSDIATLRKLCILSGCDYLPSIKGVGLRSVLKHYKYYRNIQAVTRHFSNKYRRWIPKDYWKRFAQAEYGFLYQWVYDKNEKNYIRLNRLPKDCSLEDVYLLGKVPNTRDSAIFRINKVIPRPGNSGTREEDTSITSSTKSTENTSDHYNKEEQTLAFLAYWLGSHEAIYAKPMKPPGKIDLFEYAKRIRSVMKPCSASKANTIVDEFIQYTDESKENINPNQSSLPKGRKRKSIEVESESDKTTQSRTKENDNKRRTSMRKKSLPLSEKTIL